MSSKQLTTGVAGFKVDDYYFWVMIIAGTPHLIWMSSGHK